MNIQNLIAVIAVFAAGSAFAQQTEFVAPDASFTPTPSRVEVNEGVTQAASQASWCGSSARVRILFMQRASAVGQRFVLRQSSRAARVI